MGLRDAYPFSLSENVQEKLRFVHDVIGEAAEITSDAEAANLKD
jgi:hypothetical protein